MPVFHFKDTLTAQDIALNYATFGQADRPALIFSNSLGTNLSMWQQQIAYFQDKYFVICYDTRGHGASSTPVGPYRIDQLGTDVIALLDHLQIPQAAFCGISMGGLTGQWLAIHFPERFNQVIVANSAAKIGEAQAWQARAQLVREQGLTPIAQTAATRWFTPGFIEDSPEIVEKLSHDLAQGSAEGYASCCEALAEADVRPQLQRINIPVLVIAGAQDPVTTVADGQFLCEHIVHSTLEVLEASHISNVEQPQAFNHAVEAVMKRFN